MSEVVAVRRRARPVIAAPVKKGRAPKRTQPRETEWHTVMLRDVDSPECIVGFDLSLTSTGVGILAGSRMESRALESDPLRGPERLAWYFEQVEWLLRNYEPGLVVIEGYAYDAKFGREAAGELGGVVRLALHRAGVPWISYQPSALKKFATGEAGRKIDKSLVARELYKRYGVDAVGNDEVDACGLAIMGAAYRGYAVRMIAAQRDAVAKIEK